MAEHSKIEWTDATWPIVQGCDPVSQGCANCYAIPLLWRMAHNPDPKISGPLQDLTELHVNAAGERILRFTGKIALREDRLDWPLKWKQPRMIFVPSHGDLFHKDVPDEFIDKVFAVMALCPQHTFQVLTKRAERMRRYFADRHSHNEIELAAEHMRPSAGKPFSPKHVFPWPLPNCWLGVSAERQQEADERIPHLLQTPAAVRFVSAEPLLGPIDFGHIAAPDDPDGGWTFDALSTGDYYTQRIERVLDPPAWNSGDGPHRERALDWVIVGGESGPNARDHDLQWSRDLIAQCKAAGVAVFEKQLGSRPIGKAARRLVLKDRKGGDWEEWPDDLRVREFPKAESASVIEGSMPHHGMSSPDPNQKEATRS